MKVLTQRQRKVIAGVLLNGIKRKKRRYGVQPLFRRRKIYGAYATLLPELEKNPEEFFRFFRMTIVSFNLLCTLVDPFLQKFSQRPSITTRERLAITIRYLASGDLQVSLSYLFRVGRSTTTMIIRETCDAIYLALQPIYLPSPDTINWNMISSGYEIRWNFPNCIGALDGKHVSVKAPKKSGSLYFNYKKFYSIILLAMCDSDCKFTMIDIGQAGSQSDGGVFNRSKFHEALQESKIKFPDMKPFSSNGVPYPFVIVADEAFPLKPYLMRNYPRSQLDDKKRIYNYRLSRARRTIENAFGILRARWQIFRGPINADLKMVRRITKTCCCLHNFLKVKDTSYCPASYQGYEIDGQWVDGQWRSETSGNQLLPVGRVSSNNQSREAREIRDAFADFFVSDEGSVPWQTQVISEHLNA